jgi:putative redox protein
MTLQLYRRNKAVHLEAVNEEGSTLQIDGASSVGGEGLGFRSMQFLLAALGSCSSIDIIELLRKQRQVLQDIQVKVEGERE